MRTDGEREAALERRIDEVLETPSFAACAARPPVRKAAPRAYTCITCASLVAADVLVHFCRGEVA